MPKRASADLDAATRNLFLARVTAPDVYAAEAHRVIQAMAFLELAVDRMSEAQRNVFRQVHLFEVTPLPGSIKGRAHPNDGRIEIDPAAVAKIGKGGLVWLIAHEAFHVSHAKPTRKEGNANRFANRMRTLLEREPTIYRWGGSRRRGS